MPVPDVMTTAPAQPQAPQTETIIVLPQDPATPQLPQTTVQGPGPDTPTPQVVDGPNGPQTVVVSPEDAPITEDEVLNGDTASGEANSADALLYGAALAASLGLLRRGPRQPGQIDDSMVVAASNTETLDQALEEGRITPEQYNSIDPATGGDAAGIENVSEGADVNTRQRVPQSPNTDTPRATTDAPEQPTAPSVDTEDTARPPTSADSPITTEDVMPTAAQIDTSQMPEGTRIVDVNPMQEGRFISATEANPSDDMPRGAMINTQTREMIVPTGDGRWIVMPAGNSNESVRYQHLRAVNQALRSALR
jgi:hypothetical protein